MHETVVSIDGCYYDFEFNRFGYWGKTTDLKTDRSDCIHYKIKYALYTHNLIMVYLAEMKNNE